MALRDFLRNAREEEQRLLKPVFSISSFVSSLPNLVGKQIVNTARNLPQAPFRGPGDFVNKVIFPQKNFVLNSLSKVPQAPFRSPTDFGRKMIQPIITGGSWLPKAPFSGPLDFSQKTAQFLVPQTLTRLGVGSALNAGNRPNAVFDPSRNIFSKTLLGSSPIRSTSATLTDLNRKLIQGQRFSNQTNPLLNFGQAGALPAAYGLLAGIEASPGGGAISKTLKEAAPKLAEKYGSRILKGADKIFDVSKYIKRNVAEAELARSGGEIPTIFSKTKNFFAKGKESLVEDQSIILDKLKRYGQGTEDFSPYRQWLYATDNVRKADSKADMFLKENFDPKNFFTQLRKNGLDKDSLSQYLIARHAPERARQGIATGRDLIADSKLVEQLAPQYEPFAKILDDANTKLNREIIVGTYDLKPQELFDYLEKIYPNYVSLKVVKEELPFMKSFGNGRAMAGSTKELIQKAKGSTRLKEDPIESFLAKVFSVYNVGEKKKAAALFQSFKDLPALPEQRVLGMKVKGAVPENPFNITTLKEADDVLARKALSKQHFELGKTRDLVSKWFSRQSKETRILSSEINKLQKEGLFKALRKDEKVFPEIFSKMSIKQGKTKILLKDKAAIPNKRQLHQILSAFVQEPDKVIQRIQARTDLKVAEKERLLGILNKYKSKIDEIKNTQASLRSEIKAHADIKKLPDELTLTIPSSKGNSVITADPQYMAALKGLNEEQLSSVLKAFSYITRAFKATTTGIFALINIPKQLIKDPLSAFIFGSKNLRAFTPQAYISALIDSFKLNPAYKNAIEHGAITSSFDINPRNIQKSYRDIAKGKKTVERLLGNFESFMSKFQEAEYLAQWKVLTDAYKKAGKTEEEAMKLASVNTKQFLTNFSRRGTMGQQIGALKGYVNAAIQGGVTTVRAFKERPLETGLKLAAVGYTPMVAFTAWNLSDPKRAAVYKDIIESERDTNFVIVLPTQDADGKNQVITIPIQGGLNNILKPARKIVENMYDVGDTISFKYLVDSLLGSITPLSTDMEKNKRLVVPDPILPLTDLTANKRFSGSPIFSNRDLPTAQQAYPDTSEFARFVAGLTGAAPVDVDYLGEQYFNQAYKQGTNALDNALLGTGVVEKEEAGGKSLLSEVRDLFTNPYTGQIKRDAQKKVLEYQKKSEGISNEKYQEAQSVYKELIALPREEAISKLKVIGAQDPDLAQQILDLKKSDGLNIAPEEKPILQLGVTDGTRAKYIWNEILKDLSNEEQVVKLKDLAAKKIITDKVLQQLLVLKKGN